MLQRLHGKRIISALLVLAMLVGLLPAVGEVSYASMKGELRETVTNRGTVVRGVVDSIAELPQYGKDYKSMTRGTAERPFVVLEIVPSEQYAEFGYLIDGCEPVKIEDMFGRGEINTIGSLNAADIKMHVADFFPDEREADKKYYDHEPQTITDVKSYQGYYEYVGTKEEDPDGKIENGRFDLSLKADSNGCLVWHTLNDFVDTDGITFQPEPAEDTVLTLANIGERYYTTRTSGPQQPVMRTHNYYTYENKELFLRESMRLTAEEAENYSVVIKTITPNELNQSVRDDKENNWVTYADLIHIAPKSHVGGLPKIWDDYHRKEKNAQNGKGNYKDNFVAAEYRDLDWQVTLAIYNRATQETDYAAVVMDNGIYKDIDSVETNSGYRAENMSIDVVDWNGNLSGMVYTGSTGYKNNVYKLAVMLLCMKPALFRAMYLEGEKPLIDSEGNYRIQTTDKRAKDRWNFYTFMPVPPKAERPIEIDRNPYAYWTSKEVWDNYNMTANPMTLGEWIAEHVYTYNGDNSISMDYGKDKTPGQQFSDYENYRDENKITTTRPADAVNYIIRPHGGASAQARNLKVLDIEPCVELKTNPTAQEKLAEGGMYKKNWQLKESYIRFLLPDYRGKIEITHQTTAEFNGKIEDLNSTYDLIYLGLDYGAYNTRDFWQGELKFNDGTDVPAGKYPNWNDDGQTHTEKRKDLPDLSWTEGKMDGLIYFHTGDSLISTEASHEKEDDFNAYEAWFSSHIGQSTAGPWTSADRSVKFLANGSDTTELRLPGNDITKLKSDDIKEYIAAGYPVVASKYLYELQKCFIDDTSNIYKLVKDYKTKGIYEAAQTTELQTAVGQMSRDEVTFAEDFPRRYNGVTKGSTIDVKNANYLARGGEDNSALLEFKFNVSGTSEYMYKIYVDINRDSKFSDKEEDGELLVPESEAKQGENYYSFSLAEDLVGLIQWKIEVYRRDNHNIRYVQTGCSAVRETEGADKREIKVLQIRPDNGCNLDLATDPDFKRYYQDLPDYEITVNSVSWWEYSKCFAGSGFHYALTDDLKTTDYSEALNTLNDRFKTIGMYTSGKRIDKLTDYNMIIVGFADCYGSRDMYGQAAVEYIEYFAAKGKSVLFTHDVSSFYNTKIDIKDYFHGYKAGAFGSTVSAMLRDVMGMNRYGSISNRLSKEQQKEMEEYQKSETYDWSNSDAIHGFTYFTVRRLATGWNINKDAGNQMPYKMFNSINDDNNATTKARRLNEGQITEYPYKIFDGNIGDPATYDEKGLDVAQTHGQYYELNMEDPELTVWYCLDNDGKGLEGNAIAYEVSPNDAANNYYIYSKGNIFYSGVGHRPVKGSNSGDDADMEIKLFINTMIAAYRTTYEAPSIKVKEYEQMGASKAAGVKAKVRKVDTDHYSFDIPTDYTNGVETKFNNSTDLVKIYFTPQDRNAIAVKLTGKIEMGTGTDKVVIGQKDVKVNGKTYDLSVFCVDKDDDPSNDIRVAVDENGQLVAGTNADGVKSNGLERNKTYYFYYPKELLDKSEYREISFTLNNNKTVEATTKYLNIGVEPLFLLD